MKFNEAVGLKRERELKMGDRLRLAGLQEARSDLAGLCVRFAERAMPAIATVYCLLATTSLFANYFHYSKFGTDFGVYWRTAHQPLAEVYLWQGRFPFPYAPTMLLWIAPLALLSKWVAYSLFVALSATAFVFACRAYLRAREIALALISAPVARGLFTGQICAVATALMIWACGTANRIAAGVAFGILASIKPQLVLMAPLMFVLNRDWRAFIAAGASFLSIVCLSLFLFGPERWTEWIASMNHFYHAVVDTDVIRIGTSPAIVAQRLGYPPLPFLLLGAVLGVAIVFLCREAEPLEKAAAIGLGSIMASPYALAYDLTIVVPVLALAVFRGRILAAFALAAPFHPLPFIASIYELLKRIDLRRVSAEMKRRSAAHIFQWTKRGTDAA